MEEEQAQPEPKKFSKSSIAIILILLLFVSLVVYLGFYRPPQEAEANTYSHNGVEIPFRANISDCMEVPIYPNEEALTTLLLSDTANAILVLVNPNGTGEEGASVLEIYKITTQYKPTGVVYTEPWPAQPNVPNTTIEQATFINPIIWIKPNQSKTSIEVNDSGVIVYAQDQYSLDAATCRISIAVLESSE